MFVGDDTFQLLNNISISTDDALKEVLDHAQGINITFTALHYTVNTENIERILTKHRHNTQRGLIDSEFNILFYSEIINGLIDSMSGVVVIPEGDNIWKLYISVTQLLPVIEAESVQRAIGNSYFISCIISEKLQKLITELEFNAKYQMKQAMLYNPGLVSHFEERMGTIETALQNVTIMREHLSNRDYDVICRNFTQEKRNMEGMMWLVSISAYINQLLELLDYDKRYLVVILNELVHSKKIQYYVYISITVIISVGSIMLSVFYIKSVNRMSNKIGKYSSDLMRKTSLLSAEKKKTDKLLYQMLPVCVASKLITMITYSLP